jgi:hypothetical protein
MTTLTALVGIGLEKTMKSGENRGNFRLRCNIMWAPDIPDPEWLLQATSTPVIPGSFSNQRFAWLASGKPRGREENTLMNLYRLFGSLAMTASLLVMAVPVGAADSRSSDEWQFDAAIYLWGAQMDITPENSDTIKISFNDIIDHLDMTFMGMFGARKDKWSLLADVIYMDLTDTKKGSRKIFNQTINGKVDVEMEAWIVTAAGGYNLVDTGKYSMDLLAGGRYISVDLPLKIDLGTFQRKTTPSGDIWSGIIGVRGEADLTDKWYLNYYLDGGAGQESTNTWQALAGLNYQFQKFEAGFGYRYLKWDNGDGAIEDLTVKGPYAGVRFRF